LSYDLLQRVKNIKYKYVLFFKKNLSYFGGYLAHIGFLIAVLGFLGNYRGIEKIATLNVGEKTELYGYTFSFKGIKTVHEDNALLYTAPLNIQNIKGKNIGEIYPARAKYPTKDELFHEIGLLGGFWYDIYAVLSDFDQNMKQATLQIHINPTVRVVWISVFIMVFGGICSFFDNIRGRRSRDVLGASWEV
jgi:cytochrome c-type biogenesis protein CcmF